MSKVRFGVIGLGFFGEKHAEVLDGLADVELAAVCTRRDWRLKEIAERFNVPNAYTDYNELLANDEIDAVTVVTHAKDHLAPTLAAIAAGKHVFLEKPMALTTAECDQIVEAANGSSGHFMVGHICRFNYRYALAKQAIADGAIGKVLSIHARRNIPASVSEGVLASISALTGDGIHDTDLMLWYTGASVRTIYAQTISVRGLANPDIGWAMYRFDTGAVGVIESVWYLPDKTPYPLDERMEIIGETGAIYVNEGSQPLVVNNAEGLRYAETVYWPKVHGVRAGALRDELAYFAQCVRSGKRPDIITPEESRSAVRVIEAAERSANTGQVVTLD